jgi:hypothetical protein
MRAFKNKMRLMRAFKIKCRNCAFAHFIEVMTVIVTVMTVTVTVCSVSGCHPGWAAARQPMLPIDTSLRRWFLLTPRAAL